MTLYRRPASADFRTMNLDSKIYIAGHRGLVGSALMRKLQAHGYKNNWSGQFAVAVPELAVTSGIHGKG